MPALEIDLGFNPTQLFLHAVNPTVEIDGAARPRRWGTIRCELGAGFHHVRVSFPYLWTKGACPAELSIELAEGETKRLVYRPSLIVLLPGSLWEAGAGQSRPDQLAELSMWFGLFGLFCCPPLAWTGLVLAVLALTRGQSKGKAVTGLLLGALSLVGTLLGVLGAFLEG